MTPEGDTPVDTIGTGSCAGAVNLHNSLDKSKGKRQQEQQEKQQQQEDQREMTPHVATLFNKLEHSLGGLLTVAFPTYLIGFGLAPLMAGRIHFGYDSSRLMAWQSYYCVGLGLSCFLLVQAAALLRQLYIALDPEQRRFISDFIPSRRWCLPSMVFPVSPDWSRIRDNLMNDIQEFKVECFVFVFSLCNGPNKEQQATSQWNDGDQEDPRSSNPEDEEEEIQGGAKTRRIMKQGLSAEDLTSKDVQLEAGELIKLSTTSN